MVLIILHSLHVQALETLLPCKLLTEIALRLYMLLLLFLSAASCIELLIRIAQTRWLLIPAVVVVVVVDLNHIYGLLTGRNNDGRRVVL